MERLKALLVVLVFLLLGGVGCLVFGLVEYHVATKSKPEPQVLTCAELIANGPRDNLHVRVTDYQMRLDAFVVSDLGPRWEDAYIPLVPLGAGPSSKAFRVILSTNEAHTESELVALKEQAQIQGMIINSIASLDLQTRRLLQDAYPQVDWGNCWILDHGRKPTQASHALATAAVGASLLAATVVLIVLLAKRQAKAVRADAGKPVKPGADRPL